MFSWIAAQANLSTSAIAWIVPIGNDQFFSSMNVKECGGHHAPLEQFDKVNEESQSYTVSGEIRKFTPDMLRISIMCSVYIFSTDDLRRSGCLQTLKAVCVCFFATALSFSADISARLSLYNFNAAKSIGTLAEIHGKIYTIYPKPILIHPNIEANTDTQTLPIVSPSLI